MRGTNYIEIVSDITRYPIGDQRGCSMGTNETKSPFLRLMPARIGAGFLILVLVAAGQQLSHQLSVVNIGVPVRVYLGDRFIDNLKLEDFEIFDNGKPQKVLASYYIQKKGVERSERTGGETSRGFAPPPASRHFVLLFQTTEYFPDIDKTLETFFDEVFLRGDTLDVVTPRKAYRLREDLSSRALRAKAKGEIARRLRDDILLAGGEIKALIRSAIEALVPDDLTGGERTEAEESGDPSVGLRAYQNILERLDQMRAVESKNLIAFANELKSRPGAKHVFLFFQREMIPQYSDISPAGPDNLMDMLFYKRDTPIDQEAITKAFSDASADVHFLYITKAQQIEGLDAGRRKILSGVKMKEHSEDVYQAFREIAAATGGIADASANMDRLLRKAADASERYYLLYFRPEGYASDGSFHEITVKVREGRGYRVSHRAGYFAKDVPAAPSAGEEEALPAAQPQVVEKAPESSAGRQAEELDLTGRKALEKILARASEYCRKLETAALDFVCREEVRERTYDAITAIPMDGKSSSMRGKIIGKPREHVREWRYDYQLIRRGELPVERRILLQDNGKDTKVENAQLATSRFAHTTVFMSPINLFGEKTQAAHSYKMTGEKTQDGEPIVIFDVAAKEKATSSVLGKAWVRKRDGAVLKIEWTPASMGNYEAAVQIARKINADPRIAFSSVYEFEKNGLRFPSFFEVDESYLDLGSGRKITLSKTTVEYADYKFFVVETGVQIVK